jgi:hypothetical protein
MIKKSMAKTHGAIILMKNPQSRRQAKQKLPGPQAAGTRLLPVKIWSWIFQSFYLKSRRRGLNGIMLLAANWRCEINGHASESDRPTVPCLAMLASLDFLGTAPGLPIEREAQPAMP